MFLRLCLFLIWLPFAAFAQDLPSPISDLVNDFADLIPPSDEERIAQTLQAGRDETGVHVVVVTIESIGDFGGAGQRIEDYAKTLFNSWGIGDAERNDGILILVARSDREMRIALGSGYPVIWDNAAQRVIDRYMLPAFGDADYPRGIEDGVAATFDLIARPYVAGNPPPKPPVNVDEIIPMVLAALMALGIGGLAFRRQIGNVIYRAKSCPNCGQRGLRRSFETIRDSTRTEEGSGLTHIRCPNCGNDRTEPYVISKKSSDSGSSSGGFGGGSSSGGGATGRW